LIDRIDQLRDFSGAMPTFITMLAAPLNRAVKTIRCEHR
jgi:hypothetical protein